MIISYLIDKKHVLPDKEHFNLACLCLDYLAFDCFDIQLPKQNIQDHLSNGSYAFHEYAVAHWIHHLDSCVHVMKDFDLKSVDSLEQKLRDFIRVRWPNIWIQNTSSLKKARSDYQMFSTSAIFENLLKVVTIARKEDAGAFRTASSQDNEIQLFTQLELVRTNFEEIVASLSPTSNLRGAFSRYYGQDWFKCAHGGCVYFYKGFPSASDRDQHTSKHDRTYLCTFVGCHVAITGCRTAKELAKHVSEFHPTGQDGTHTFPSRKPMGLKYAVIHGKLDDVEGYLQAANFDSSPKNFLDYLKIAAERGHDAVLQRLLKSHNIDHDAFVKVIYKAVTGKKESTTIMLLMIRKNYFGMGLGPLTLESLLTSAASNGLDAIVKILLEKRRNLITSEKLITSEEKGLSALCFAAYNGHKTVVKQILESNQLDLRLTDPDHPGPISCAAGDGHETIVQILLQYPNCVATNERDVCWLGVAQLFNAARKGDRDIVRQLLARKDVPPNHQSRTGHTPLMLASKNGHAATVKLLLGHQDIRPNTNTRHSHVTALCYAARHGHESVVKLLLAQDGIDTRGSRKGLRRPRGPNLQEEALHHGHHSIVALLSEHALNHPQPASPHLEEGSEVANEPDLDLGGTDGQTEHAVIADGFLLSLYGSSSDIEDGFFDMV